MKKGEEIKKLWQLLMVSMSVALCVLDLFVVNIAIPTIQKSLDMHASDAQFIIVFYVLGYGAFMITGSKLGLRYGAKCIFIVSMLSFALFSLLCGIASSAVELNVSRFFQGVSAALMVPSGVALISDMFESEKERTKAFGIYGIIAGIASVFGQVLGGVVPDLHIAFGAWRLIFFFNIPIVILVVFVVSKMVTETPRKSESIQWTSQLVLVSLLILLIYQIIISGESGWNAWRVMLVAFACIGLFLFVWNQYRRVKEGEKVLINMKPFEYKSFCIALSGAALYFLVQDAYFFVNANFFQQKLEIKSSQTGLLFAFQGIGYVVASTFSIRLLNKYKEKFLVFGLLVMIVNLFLHLSFAQSLSHHSFYIKMVLFFYGIGCGIVLPSMFTYAMSKLPKEETAVASGVYLTIQQISIALGVSLIGRIYFHWQNGYFGATITMLSILLLTILLFLMGRLIKKT